MSVQMQLLVILACMVAGAFFAGMETGVISIHRLRLRHFVRKGSLNARLLQGFLENPDRLLGTTLVGTNVSVVVISVISASMAAELIGDWGRVVSSGIVTVVVLVFCEYLPKAWFHSRPIERCIRFAGVLRVTEAVFRPFATALVQITRLLVPGHVRPFAKPAPFVTREDLKILAQEGEKDGVLSRRERLMIHRVFELSGKQARQIMVPRARMTVAYEDMPVSSFLETARSSNFTRMPVFNRENRTFVGIVNVFFVLSASGDDRRRTVGDFARPPLFVRENMPVDDILPHMRRGRQPMCLVADQQENVVGLVTTEDILEEIVGKL